MVIQECGDLWGRAKSGQTKHRTLQPPQLGLQGGGWREDGQGKSLRGGELVGGKEGLESIGEDFALRSKVVVKTCCFDNIDPDILCYVLDTS